MHLCVYYYCTLLMYVFLYDQCIYVQFMYMYVHMYYMFVLCCMYCTYVLNVCTVLVYCMYVCMHGRGWKLDKHSQLSQLPEVCPVQTPWAMVSSLPGI